MFELPTLAFDKGMCLVTLSSFSEVVVLGQCNETIEVMFAGITMFWVRP